jgi:hypothetical protein
MFEDEKFDVRRKEMLEILDGFERATAGYCPSCKSDTLPDLIELELRTIEVTKIDDNAKLVHTGNTLDYDEPSEEAINWPPLQLKCRECGWQWAFPEGYTVEPM